MRLPWRTITIVFTAFVAGGCGTSPSEPRTDTGAEAAARSFFDALVRADWPAAYDLIDFAAGPGLTREQFALRAQVAMAHVGFKPTAASVTVAENGNEATAVAVFHGTGGQRYKDGVAMRRTARGWLVALRANFGAESPGGQRRRMKA